MKYLYNKLSWLTLLIFAACLIATSSCKKYLDAKPNLLLAIPSSFKDLQALLNETYIMNQNGPQIPTAAADEYYTITTSFQSASQYDQSIYIWNTKLNSTLNDVDWQQAYIRIEVANTVLDYVDQFKTNQSITDYNKIKGSALFFRRWDFYNLSQVYSPPYNSANSALPYGICLRLSSSITDPSKRSTVQETYDRIILDLKTASSLLPVTSNFPTDPSRPAALGLLARVYLSMSDYKNAALYADSCLNFNSKLIDYNSIVPNQSNPFQQFNDEVIFHCGYSVRPIVRNGYIDTVLYSSYSNNDLRKQLYYTSNARKYIGTYTGDYETFNGIATDEMYLIKAECEARDENIPGGLSDLNTLIAKRFITGTFAPFTASSSSDLLQFVLMERRKELAFRGLRWTDLRRLNQDPVMAVTLTRNINGTTYSLAPNDKHYTFLIPQNVTNITNFQNNPY